MRSVLSARSRGCAALATTTVLFAACGGGQETSVEVFCSDVGAFVATPVDENDDDVAAYQALAEAAPADIAEDFERMVEVLGELEVLGTSDADYERAVIATSDPAFIASADLVGSYVLEHCGIDLVGPDLATNGAAEPRPVQVFGISAAEIDTFLETTFSFREQKLGRRLIGGDDGEIAVDLVSGTPRDALDACNEVASWMAAQPTAIGVGRITLSFVNFDDDGFVDATEVVAIHNNVRPAEPGTCTGP